MTGTGRVLHRYLPAAALFVALIVAWQLAATVFRLRDYLLSAANDSYAPNIRGAGQP